MTLTLMQGTTNLCILSIHYVCATQRSNHPHMPTYTSIVDLSHMTARALHTAHHIPIIKCPQDTQDASSLSLALTANLFSTAVTQHLSN